MDTMNATHFSCDFNNKDFEINFSDANGNVNENISTILGDKESSNVLYFDKINKKNEENINLYDISSESDLKNIKNNVSDSKNVSDNKINDLNDNFKDNCNKSSNLGIRLFKTPIPVRPLYVAGKWIKNCRGSITPSLSSSPSFNNPCSSTSPTPSHSYRAGSINLNLNGTSDKKITSNNKASCCNDIGSRNNCSSGIFKNVNGEAVRTQIEHIQCQNSFSSCGSFFNSNIKLISKTKRKPRPDIYFLDNSEHSDDIKKLVNNSNVNYNAIDKKNYSKETNKEIATTQNIPLFILDSDNSDYLSISSNSSIKINNNHNISSNNHNNLPQIRYTPLSLLNLSMSLNSPSNKNSFNNINNNCNNHNIKTINVDKDKIVLTNKDSSIPLCDCKSDISNCNNHSKTPLGRNHTLVLNQLNHDKMNDSNIKNSRIPFMKTLRSTSKSTTFNIFETNNNNIENNNNSCFCVDNMTNNINNSYFNEKCKKNNISSTSLFMSLPSVSPVSNYSPTPAPSNLISPILSSSLIESTAVQNEQNKSLGFDRKCDTGHDSAKASSENIISVEEDEHNNNKNVEEDELAKRQKNISIVDVLVNDEYDQIVNETHSKITRSVSSNFNVCNCYTTSNYDNSINNNSSIFCNKSGIIEENEDKNIFFSFNKQEEINDSGISIDKEESEEGEDDLIFNKDTLPYLDRSGARTPLPSNGRVITFNRL